MSSKTSTSGSDHQLLMHRLRMQHLSDMPAAATSGSGTLGWFGHLFDDVFYYLRWTILTWFNVLLSLPSYVIDPLGGGLVLGFALAATVILAVMMVVSSVVRLPPVQALWKRISQQAGGVGLGNFAYPKIFDSLSPKIRQAAFKVMSDPLAQSADPSSSTTRVFDLEVAKVLMCCSSLVYERNVEMVNDAARLTNQATAKAHLGKADGPVLQMPNGVPNIEGQAVMDKLDQADAKIVSVAHSWGLEYISLSELASNTSPVCGAFWNPNRNFIMLVFKGTNPVEFREWAIDLTIRYTSGGAWLPGHDNVHAGFFDTLFPRRLRKGQTAFPYEEIRTRVREIAQQLCHNSPDRKVNLYVTGHSLGAAIASFFFARAVASVKDFGLNEDGENLIRLRDAYCFACPVFGDPQSISAFGAAVHDEMDTPVTLWRVTNRHDAVATMLPEGGDYEILSHISPTSPFQYAHLGQEIQMRRNVKVVGTGPGTLLPWGWKVKIVTHLDGDGAGPDVQLPLYYRILEDIPWLGRLIGHIASSYWSRLCKVKADENVPWLNREPFWLST